MSKHCTRPQRWSAYPPGRLALLRAPTHRHRLLLSCVALSIVAGLRPWARRLMSAVAVVGLMVAALPVQAEGNPDIRVEKSCAMSGPQSVLCTIMIDNMGNVATANTFNLGDTVTSPGATFAGSVGNASCALGAGPGLPVWCTIPQALQPGYSMTLQLSFNVGTSGTFRNCATATQTQNPMQTPDTNQANNTHICATLELGGGGNNGGGGDDPRNGKITIVKQVRSSNEQAGAGPFVVQVKCDPAASQQSVSLSAPGFAQTIAVPPGATCKIQEVRPEAPKGCRWITTYPNGQSGKDGDTLIVQNQLLCKDPPKGGEITIVKQVRSSNEQAGAGPFVVQVKCDPAASQQSVSLSAPGFAQTIAVPPGATCKIQEVQPKAPKGCRWITTYPNGQSGKDGDSLVVENRLLCKDPPKGGEITIVKKIGGDLSSLADPGPFDVQVKCDPAASQQTVSLSAPGFSHVLAVAQGAKCEIREVTPKAPKGCRWITTYPDGQTGRDGDTLVVQNELSCKPTCPRGQTLTRFPGSEVTYCCNGKPGSDKFCCARTK